ncbi:MAG: hypothetical protein ACLSUW_03675 [Akkermansia sp.]
MTQGLKKKSGYNFPVAVHPTTYEIRVIPGDKGSSFLPYRTSLFIQDTFTN